MSDEQEDQAPFDDPATEMSLAKLTVLQIEQEVGVLAETITQDQILTWLGLSYVLLHRVKEIRRRVEESAIGWINANGRIQCGPMTYSVGKQKRVTCTDGDRCLHLLLDACNGDIGELCSFLRSDPFRYGACAQVLDDARWNSVFRIDWSDKLVLKHADSRFLPRPVANKA